MVEYRSAADVRTLREIRDRLPSSLTAGGNFRVAVVEDQVGLARSSDIADLKSTLHGDLYDGSTGRSAIAVLQSIDSKVATEGTLSTVADRLYDSAEAKSITQVVREVRDRLPPSLTSDGNLRVAIVEDQVGVAKSSDVADLKSTLYDSSTGKSAIAVLQSIDSKVATESTLSTVADRLFDSAESKSVAVIVRELRDRLPSSLTAGGNLRVAVVEDGVNLLKEGGTVNVANFPSEYPLPASQVAALKNKVRLMVWNPSAGSYELIEGYKGKVDLIWDSSGNLAEVQMEVILDDGTVKTVKRSIAYDENGNPTYISRWELVS